MPQIEVTFDIDANGILHVSAKDLGTGKEQSIQIKSSSGLSDADIKKMMKDAEEHSDEDKKTRALVDAKNQADHLVWNIEKTVKEHGDKVTADDRKKIEEAIENLKKVKEGDSKEDIDRAVEELNQASHKIAQAMYEEAARQRAASGAGAGAAGGAGGAGGGSERPAEEEQGKGKKEGGDENVIDADFEVKE
jgi:molecular chaperone DnaK